MTWKFPDAEQGVVITGALMVVAMLIFLVLAQRAGKIDLSTMIVDQKDGSTSLRKFGEMVASLATTWILLYQTVHDTLTEWVFGVYVTAWVTRTVLGVLAGAKAASMAPVETESTDNGAPPALPSGITRGR